MIYDTFFKDELNEFVIEDSNETILTEATSVNKTYLMRDALYPKVEEAFKNSINVKRFTNAVSDYINRNGAKLQTPGPLYQLTFHYNDKKVFYDLFGISETKLLEMLKKITKQINDKANWQLIRQNPVFSLFYHVIRYFTIKKDEKSLNAALIITALAFYPSTFKKYFPFEPNEGVMLYTIDNMSKRFLIKQEKHVFGMISTSILSSYSFLKPFFIDGSDQEMIRFIQRIRNDHNSLMKSICRNYNDNKAKGLSISTAVDEYEDEANAAVDNDANKVESVVNSILMKLITNGVDIKASDFAAETGSISKNDLRNYLMGIVTTKKREELHSFIESILFIYIYDEKHTLRDIRSKEFIAFAIRLFKKTNSIDRNIKNIKSIVDKWGEETGVYKKFSRVATRVNYTKAFFFFFVYSIQKYV